MNSSTIRALFYDHKENLIHKWDHYFDIYEKHFSSFRDQKVNLLEIGISHGGSLQLWKKYFGEKVHVYAIDINPECKKLEEENKELKELLRVAELRADLWQHAIQVAEQKFGIDILKKSGAQQSSHSKTKSRKKK